MSKTICIGYIPYGFSDYKSWFELRNGIFERHIDTIFNYCDIEECYDKNGKPVGTFRKNFTSKRESILIGNESVSVVQIDYNFYLISNLVTRTINDILEAASALNNSNLGVFESDSTVIYTSHSSRMYMKPIEICKIGTSTCVARKSVKSFRDIDYNEYTKRLNDFLKKIDSDSTLRFKDYLEGEAKAIYDKNIEFASVFYGANKGSIIKNSFNKQKLALEVLQQKINYKQEKQTRWQHQ